MQSEQAQAQFEQGHGGVLGKSLTKPNGIVKKIGDKVGTFLFRPGRIHLFGEKAIRSICLPNPRSFGHLQIKGKDQRSIPEV